MPQKPNFEVLARSNYAARACTVGHVPAVRLLPRNHHWYRLHHWRGDIGERRDVKIRKVYLLSRCQRTGQHGLHLWPDGARAPKRVTYPMCSISVFRSLSIEHPPDAFQMQPGTFRVPFPHLPRCFRRDSRHDWQKFAA